MSVNEDKPMVLHQKLDTEHRANAIRMVRARSGRNRRLLRNPCTA